ncbi:Uncharacterised protein [Mycobacteroides abscessus subsp. abscessus]|nr:Uncharacterised protein [Mycobacteroides abscessus subsp. abscessus]
MVRGKTIGNTISADLFGVVDEQRNPGAHTRFEEHVMDAVVVARDHDTELAQQRRHRRQRGHAGDLLDVAAE